MSGIQVRIAQPEAEQATARCFIAMIVCHEVCLKLDFDEHDAVLENACSPKMPMMHGDMPSFVADAYPHSTDLAEDGGCLDRYMTFVVHSCKLSFAQAAWCRSSGRGELRAPPALDRSSVYISNQFPVVHNKYQLSTWTSQDLRGLPCPESKLAVTLLWALRGQDMSTQCGHRPASVAS